MKDPHDMMNAYLEGEMSAQQVQELENWLRADRHRERAFVRFVMLHCQLSEELRYENLNIFTLSDMNDSDFGSMLSALDDKKGQATQPVDISHILEQRELEAKAKLEENHAMFSRRFGLHTQSDTRPQTRQYVIPLPLFYGGIAAMLAVVAAVLWSMVVPPQSNQPLEAPTQASLVQVAVVVDQIGAQWKGASHPLKINGAVFNEPITLTKGFARLKFNNEAEIVLEAPVTIKPISDTKVSITSGRLVGYCATPTSRGFTVVTPDAQIVDLGTEFGVDVMAGKGVRVTVFDGEVDFQQVAVDGEVTRSLRLKRHESASASAKSGTFARAMFEPQIFVRADVNFIDLADVVSGGDGTGTGKTEWGIDPLTGNFGPVPSPWNREGVGGFNLVPQLPFVDGVFFADGKFGPLQVTSSNDQFNDPPTNNANIVYDYVRRGSPPTRTGALNFSHGTPLDGEIYGTATSSAITLHPNKGVTFDLDEIRKSYPFSRLAKFTATAGMHLDPARPTLANHVDFWVLVDGEMRFQRIGFNEHGRGVDINVDISDNDRFLTLITMDGGDGVGQDWLLFGRPYLYMEKK